MIVLPARYHGFKLTPHETFSYRLPLVEGIDTYAETFKQSFVLELLAG